MRIRRESKTNADLLKEFKVTRYLWSFAEEWRSASKAHRLGDYWGRLAGALEIFDTVNPISRRIAPSQIQVPTQVDQTMARPSRPRTPNPEAGPITRPQNQKPGALAKAVAVPITPARTPNVAVAVTRPSRPRSPQPVASTSRLPVQVQDKEPSSRIPQPGVRIKYRPQAKISVPTEDSTMTESDDDSDDSNDDDDGNDGGIDRRVIYVKSKKSGHAEHGIGNSAEADQSDKAVGKQNEKKRKTPQSGRPRAEPCSRCERLKYICYDQLGGKACYHCARSKIKCEGHGEEEGYVTEFSKPKAKKATPAARKRRQVRVVLPAPVSPSPPPPPPPPKTRASRKKAGKAKMVYPETEAEVENMAEPEIQETAEPAFVSFGALDRATDNNGKSIIFLHFFFTN